jgi:hypothetical protein
VSGRHDSVLLRSFSLIAFFFLSLFFFSPARLATSPTVALERVTTRSVSSSLSTG